MYIISKEKKSNEKKICITRLMLNSNIKIRRIIPLYQSLFLGTGQLHVVDTYIIHTYTG